MEVIGYNVDGAVEIVLNGASMTVPADINNIHWQMILGWVSKGNIIPPYVPHDPPLPSQR